MTSTEPILPLTGIRVITTGQILAAPFCSTLFAEFGADVIKVERRALANRTAAVSRLHRTTAASAR